MFSGAVAELHGEPVDGATVRVQSCRGEFLGWGAYSSRSQIRVRIWSWDAGESIGMEYFQRRLERAIACRRKLIPSESSNAIRMVHGESDGLPGLIVDVYRDTGVVQLLSAGAEFWRGAWIALLPQLLDLRVLYERSDADVRELEGLECRTGALAGDMIETRILIEEYGVKYWVDIRTGHKTGFYLDQRDNRLRLRGLVKDRDVLDCFCYTGGFALNALAGGARRVLAIDTSSEVLQLARENLLLNGFASEAIEFQQADVFQQLRRFRDQGRKFDLVILDPPKFAPTSAQVERAARGYKDINLLALKLLRPGGILCTFSCSGGVDAGLFQKIVAGAALDAGAEVRIIGYLHQAADHPVQLSFPEGAYLKGLALVVDRADLGMSIG